MSSPRTTIESRSPYETKLLEVFDDQQKVLDLFRLSFRDWCFKNRTDADALFQKLEAANPELELSGTYGKDVGTVMAHLLPSISHAMNRSRGATYTLFKEKNIKDVQLLMEANDLKETLIRWFIRGCDIKWESSTLVRLLIGRVDNFLSWLNTPAGLTELAGTSTLVLNRITDPARWSDTLKIPLEWIEIQVLFSHTNTFDPEILRKVSDPLMDFFFAHFSDESRGMSEMFWVSDMQFFQVLRALLFEQSPTWLAGTTGHDIFRFTEICNTITSKIFRNPDLPTQKTFIDTIRKIILAAGKNPALANAPDTVILSSVWHVFETNKKSLSARLQKEKIYDHINHPEHSHAWLSLDDLSLNEDRFRYSLGKEGAIKIDIDTIRFPVEPEDLRLFSFEKLLSIFAAYSRSSLLSTDSWLSISYYDFDFLIQDLSEFARTGTSRFMDYTSLLDLHDRDLTINTLVHAFLTDPASGPAIQKHFPNDTQNCLWFILKKFFADIHKQFEEANIPPRKLNKRLQKNSD